MTPEESRPGGPTVFLSYAHDDDNHVAAVLELASFLVACGIHVEFDHWSADSRQDWFAWMLREIQAADFVLVVASPMYRAVGDGTVDSDRHRGVQAETAILRDLLYADRATWLRKVLPVVLPGRSVHELPVFTQPAAASHFVVDAISDDGAEGLLRVLTGQPRHVRPPRGRIPRLPPIAKWVFPAKPMVREFRWPVVRRAVALAATLFLVASVFAIPERRAPGYEVNADHTPEAPRTGPLAAGGTSTAGPSQERPSTGATLPGPTGTPGTGDQSRRPPTPDGDGWGAPVMPEGAPTDGMPSHQGVLDVMDVGHSFATGVDRITVAVRNTHPDDVLIRQIDVFMDDDMSGHPWADPSWWYFSMSRDMVAGAPAYDGSQRVHGTIRMSGSAFDQPLVGRGYIEDRGSWRRLLTFEPQRFLAGAEVVSIVIDVPITHLMQGTSPGRPAGPVTERTLDPREGAVFTRVDLWTPDDHSFGCDHLRRPEDKPVCDQVDPAAAVELPG
ncbi:hypothetical protein JCM33774_56480 [Actinophytocola sp. KF-1]